MLSGKRKEESAKLVIKASILFCVYRLVFLYAKIVNLSLPLKACKNGMKAKAERGMRIHCFFAVRCRRP